AFTIAYYRSTDATFGNADDVLLASEALSADADKAVGAHSGNSPALQITSGGTFYLFAKVDGSNAILEADETNNVAQGPAQISVAVPVIVDNSQAGYSETGTNWLTWSAGYGGNLRYHAAGSGANTAVWQTSVTPGYYRVQATWTGDANHADNAPFSIYDGATLLQTVTVNQRPYPPGDVASGITFHNLTTLPISSGA